MHKDLFDYKLVIRIINNKKSERQEKLEHPKKISLEDYKIKFLINFLKNSSNF